jgi:hypothetical protein
MPWLVMHSSTISASRSASESTLAFCFTGTTKEPCPVTVRNCVASFRRFEPEISSASFGAGTCQKNIGGSPWGVATAGWGHEHRTCRDGVDDHDAAVPRDRLIGPGGKRLAATAHRQQHLAGPLRRDGYRDPPDLSDKAFLRAHGHLSPAF